MNKDIIEILEKSEEIKFEVKSTEDYKYYFIKGLYGKVFLLCEERKNLEDTLKIVEKLCISDEVLKDMWPQFIYVIIMKLVNQVNNQTLKEIISVEENEYFCKKYVLYYEKKEIDEENTKPITSEQMEEITKLVGEEKIPDMLMYYKLDKFENMTNKLAQEVIARRTKKS